MFAQRALRADDAVQADRGRGLYAEPSKVRPIRHHGPHFQVPGIPPHVLGCACGENGMIWSPELAVARLCSPIRFSVCLPLSWYGAMKLAVPLRTAA